MLAPEKFPFLNSNFLPTLRLFRNFLSRRLSAKVICNKEQRGCHPLTRQRLFADPLCTEFPLHCHFS
jgi:hypothetical protein